MGTFSPAFIQTFKSNFVHSAQQTESKLFNIVQTQTQNSETDWVKVFGKLDFAANTAALGDATVFDGVDITSRAINLSKFSKGIAFQNIEEIKLGEDPTSNIVKALSAGAGRYIDSLILTAALGNATGKTNTGTIVNNLALGAGQTVAVDVEVTGTNTNLTLAKVAKAAEKFDNADVTGKRYLVVTPNQIHALLRDTKVGSVDYNTVRALQYGELNEFYGFTFVKIASANSVLVSGTTSTAVAMTEDAVTLSLGSGSREPNISIEKEILKNNDILVLSEMFAGCTRIQEDRVVKILCDNTK